LRRSIGCESLCVVAVHPREIGALGSLIDL